MNMDKELVNYLKRDKRLERCAIEKKDMVNYLVSKASGFTYDQCKQAAEGKKLKKITEKLIKCFYEGDFDNLTEIYKEIASNMNTFGIIRTLVSNEGYWFKLYRTEEDSAEYIKIQADSLMQAKAKLSLELKTKPYVYPTFLSTGKQYPRSSYSITNWEYVTDAEVSKQTRRFKHIEDNSMTA